MAWPEKSGCFYTTKMKKAAKRSGFFLYKKNFSFIHSDVTAFTVPCVSQH